MYWVHWNTRKARLARKSRADSRPATGRSWKPVRSAGATGGQGAGAGGGGPRWPHRGRPAPPSRWAAPFRKRETSSSWGMLSSRYPQNRSSSSKASRCSRQAWVA